MFWLGWFIGILIGIIFGLLVAAMWIGNTITATVNEVLRDLEENGHLK